MYNMIRMFASICRRNSVSKILGICFTFAIITTVYFILVSSYGITLRNNIAKRRTCIEPANISDIDHRPRFVLGILSSDKHVDYRNAQRSTWISSMQLLRDELPFRIAYRFLLDLPTNETISENKKYKDILFLNVTTHGRAVKFGEKLYWWLKYVHDRYPDALLTAKLDDDTFLCVPQVFQRLDQHKSKTLYYGWTHFGATEKLNTHQYYMDEMFVVIGKNLVERIAKRNYCGERICNRSMDLMENDFADTSLVQWLSVYNDIDHVADNGKIVHMGKGMEARILKNIKPGFCSKYILNHKSNVEVMNKLHEYNKPSTFSPNDMIGAVTGSLFSGEIVRTQLPQSLTNNHKYFAAKDKMQDCENWAVVTTIFSPSKAIKHVANLSDWCLVIVADRKTPLEGTYMPELGTDKNTNKRIKYLSEKEQNVLYPLLSEVIPFNHFGRKNIGYMYAIHHKAKYIWDFDDDNHGIIDIDDFRHVLPFPYVTDCQNASRKNLLNPYPYFGVTESLTWPRGFPLQDIKNKTTTLTPCTSNTPFTLGIVQSLANQQPDVDAIYRMTRDTPFNFQATRKSRPPFVLPVNTYAPFNAQATLWFAHAFPYMALPISVNGRVSDIWRSYIAQYFFHRNGLRLVFSPPYVTQDRNHHNILRDFNAELDLYTKSKQLVDFLSSQKAGNQSDIVELYKQLYKRQYLEQYDIQFAEAWTKTSANLNK